MRLVRVIAPHRSAAAIARSLAPMGLSTDDAGTSLPPPFAPPGTPTEPPPPPPPPELAMLDADRRAATATKPPVRGQLTPGWRFTTALTWSLVFVALLAVSSVSRQLGLATWWLGTLGQPRPFLVQVLPFVPSAVMVVLTVNNSRRIPWVGVAGAVWLVAVGIADVRDVTRLGIVELAIAGCALAVSVASFAGRYR